ncbi:unnamed protein product, partial [Polarella glacialis]
GGSSLTASNGSSLRATAACSAPLSRNASANTDRSAGQAGGSVLVLSTSCLGGATAQAAPSPLKPSSCCQGQSSPGTVLRQLVSSPATPVPDLRALTPRAITPRGFQPLGVVPALPCRALVATATSSAVPGRVTPSRLPLAQPLALGTTPQRVAGLM